MRKPNKSITRSTVTVAIVLAMSAVASAADSGASTSQIPAASLLDQLLSLPAPLRSSSSVNTTEADFADKKSSWLSIAGHGANDGMQWKFALDRSASTQAPQALDSMQRFSASFIDSTQDQQALLQSIGGIANSLVATAPRNDGLSFSPTLGAYGDRQAGQWFAAAARYMNNVQISANMPLESSFVMQAPTETIQAAINSSEVTEHLEQHSESVSLLAQLLGWQKTGLLPNASDLQKMASDHVGAVASRVERWALQNVNISASSHALDGAESQEQIQWQWSVTTNSSQFNSNSVADNEANFSANLRRLFGMNDYY